MWSIKINLFILILIYIDCSVALNILGIFPLPGRSHYTVGEEILKGLAEKGHKVDVISHFPQKKEIPNFTDYTIAGSIPLSVNNMTFQESQMTGDASMEHIINKLGEQTCDLLEHSQFKNILKKPKKSYDVIVVEVFFANCYLAFGQHFDVPVVGVLSSKMLDWLYTPFGNEFNPAYIGTILSSFSQQMNFIERLKNTYIYYLTTYKFNYYVEKQLYHVEKYFGLKLTSIKKLYDDVALLLVNSHHSIVELKPQTPDIIDIGGVHVHSKAELTPDLKNWLDESKDGCVYISFGSMVRIETLPAEQLKAFYETFENIAPVRVLMKIADPKLLPSNLPKNVKTSTWLPQVAVLKHENTKAFVTHGGLLGTQESIAWGVPLIGFPLFGDQHANLENYARKKIAVVLQIKSFNSEKLTNAIKKVLNEPEYRINAKKISNIFMDRPMSPKDTAVYWIEYIGRHGNSLKSPATKLSWWQLYLLDVYGFVFCSIIILLYISKKIINLLYKLFSSRKYESKNSKTSLKKKQ
ncbi:hypothetical protein HCN44_004993 [Aphidius gifuensis]|uniref:UDP-glucuronosyltransferase n=2 Tax=Aphidius gifuensis TaxID=684658 RepID=A0A834XWW3_APHGI|nr:hypothetical protein HCN44_004993 [Aphidius gifuensis]